MCYFWIKATEEQFWFVQALGAHQLTLQPFKSTILSRNVDLNML